MFSQFYHGLIRKYVIIFGTLFNNIKINRQNSDGKIVQSMKVPLSYGPKEKFLARLEGDPNLNRPFAEILPRMAFEISSINYAPDRKLNTITKHVKQNANTQQLSYAYQSVPYDIGFTLYIMVKNADDGTRIVEQILPYFTPDWTVSAQILPSLDMTLDIPIVFQNIIMQDTYEGDFNNRRAIVWSLDFVLKGHLFGPVKKSGIIKIANTNFYIPSTNTAAQGIGVSEVRERITITPGLTANGEPTSNAELSIDISQITANSNYGYIVEFQTDL